MPGRQRSPRASQSRLARIIAHAGGSPASAEPAEPAVTPPAQERAQTDAALIRVGAYCRYSSHHQDDGYSLEAQHEAVEREAATLGSWAVRFYDEPATSAWTDELGERPVFLRMLRDAADGKLDMVVVHRLDRFSRKVAITANVVPALLECGVQFLSLTERLDATTPAGQLHLHMIGSFAEYDSAHKGAQIKNGQRQRAKSGLHNSRIPYGYRATGAKTPAEPDMPPDGASDADDPRYTWNGLMRFLRLALSGLPDYAIADRLNAEGYRLPNPGGGSRDADRLFSRVTVSVLRRNTYYRPYTPGDDRGTIHYGGAEYRGAHRAAMTWEEWQQVQGMARNRRWGWNTPGMQRHYAPTGTPFTAEFRGLAVCAECGSRLYVWRNASNLRQGRHSVYERYACSAHKRLAPCGHDGQWGRVEDVRHLWLMWLREHLTLPGDWQRIIRDRLRERATQPATGSDAPTAAHLRLERLRWTDKRNRAIEVYTDGLKDRAWMETRVAEADAALLALERAERPQAVERARLVDAGRFLLDVAEMWEAGTTEQRIVLASHIIAPGGLHLSLCGRDERRGNRWHPYQPGVTPTSCAITRVDLQPAFRDLLAMLQREATPVA